MTGLWRESCMVREKRYKNVPNKETFKHTKDKCFIELRNPTHQWHLGCAPDSLG